MTKITQELYKSNKSFKNKILELYSKKFLKYSNSKKNYLNKKDTSTITDQYESNTIKLQKKNNEIFNELILNKNKKNKLIEKINKTIKKNMPKDSSNSAIPDSLKIKHTKFKLLESFNREKTNFKQYEFTTDDRATYKDSLRKTSVDSTVFNIYRKNDLSKLSESKKILPSKTNQYLFSVHYDSEDNSKSEPTHKHQILNNPTSLFSVINDRKRYKNKLSNKINNSNFLVYNPEKKDQNSKKKINYTDSISKFKTHKTNQEKTLIKNKIYNSLFKSISDKFLKNNKKTSKNQPKTNFKLISQTNVEENESFNYKKDLLNKFKKLNLKYVNKSDITNIINNLNHYLSDYSNIMLYDGELILAKYLINKLDLTNTNLTDNTFKHKENSDHSSEDGQNNILKSLEKLIIVNIEEFDNNDLIIIKNERVILEKNNLLLKKHIDHENANEEIISSWDSLTEDYNKSQKLDYLTVNYSKISNFLDIIKEIKMIMAVILEELNYLKQKLFLQKNIYESIQIKQNRIYELINNKNDQNLLILNTIKKNNLSYIIKINKKIEKYSNYIDEIKNNKNIYSKYHKKITKLFNKLIIDNDTKNTLDNNKLIFNTKTDQKLGNNLDKLKSDIIQRDQIIYALENEILNLKKKLQNQTKKLIKFQ